MASLSRTMSSVCPARLGSLFLIMLAILTGGATAVDSGQSAHHLTVHGFVPIGKVGVDYNGTASASRGVAPYHYAVTRGALPDGVAVDGKTGRISGVPQTAGLFRFVMSAWDKNGVHGDKTLTLTVKSESISVSISPTTAVVTSGGSQQFTAAVTGTSNTAVS